MTEIRYLDHNWLAHKLNRRLVEKHSGVFVGRVIDLGCGIAPYKAEILKHAREYTGVDWENSLHDQSNVDIFADLCEKLPLEGGCADTVVSFQVMEHLPEPSRFLAEAFRILRPGGRIFIVVPFMWHVHEAPHDYFRYTRYGLDYLLRKAGFVDVAIAETTGFWQTWILKFNYYSLRFAPGPLKLLWAPVWWLGQAVAPLLDRISPCPGETGSYSVVAGRP